MNASFSEDPLFDGRSSTRIARRSFLARAASWSLALSGFALLSAGCRSESPSRDEQLRLAREVGALYPVGSDSQAIATASGWTREEALQILTAGVSELPNSRQLPLFLETRRREDFIAGRVALVDRWTLSQTEVAVAVLAAGTSG